LVLVVALQTGGCGDSGRSEAPDQEIVVATGSLSKPQFVKKVDQICQETRKQFESDLTDLIKNTASPSGELPPAAVGGIVRSTFVPNYEKFIDRVGSLGAPEGDEKQITAFLRAVHQIVENASENPAKAFRSYNFFKPAGKLAKAYGLNGCEATM
jgi:hypothetical protein